MKAPPRIRTDENPFAHHTIEVRVPAILENVLERNPDYPPETRSAIRELAQALHEGRPLPPIDAALPYAEGWLPERRAREGETWLSTDWFFAETYAYRQLVDRAHYWTTERDPFVSYKDEEYAGEAHAAALDRALGLSGAADDKLCALFGAALWGNRIDLSFAASLVRGMAAESDDLLDDDREAAVRCVLDGTGPLHVVADNAGTELTMDLVLADFVLHEIGAKLVLHVKVHPTFVSDATAADVRRFLERPLPGAAGKLLSRLRDAIESGALEVRPHPFWNGPLSLWELPSELVAELGRARLVVLKGDANYRRALGDAIWPPEMPFAEATSYFPGPLLALRTLKSDPITGLAPGKAAELDAIDPTWRVNGKRGVASFRPRP